MRRRLTDEERAAREGFRLGKWGYEVTRCPYAPGDMSPEARAWRKGWTLGSYLLQRATGLSERRGQEGQQR